MEEGIADRVLGLVGTSGAESNDSMSGGKRRRNKPKTKLPPPQAVGTKPVDLRLKSNHYDINMPQQFEFTPIGTVHSPVLKPVDDIWGGIQCRIDLNSSRFTPDCLLGLTDFSHVEVVFLFHRVQESEITTGSRHPRNRPDWPRVGIFAQRGKNRPNRIGVTICRLLSVDDLSLEVAGLDAVDGTPVLDIKPYMREFAARGEVRQPKWVDELMRGYWENTYFG